MKKLLFVLLLLGCVTLCYAQRVQESVYLKNGGMIRGTIIEQIPGVSIKVQTSDGSIYSYQMSMVDKITKDRTTVGSMYNGKSGNERGYKGFVDFGYTLGVGDFGEDRIEFSTSHGCQINPYLYVGGGVGANYYIDAELYGVPIFANVRANILDNQISPYIDFKIGYSIGDVEGLYLAPSLGCKIHSFNISIGYVMQRAEFYSYYYDEIFTDNCGGLSFKIGFEF